MQILVLCDHCQKFHKIESDNVGKRVSAFNLFLNLEPSWSISNVSDLEEMDEISESDVEVKDIAIKISCPKCGEYIIIDNINA